MFLCYFPLLRHLPLKLCLRRAELLNQFSQIGLFVTLQGLEHLLKRCGCLLLSLECLSQLVFCEMFAGCPHLLAKLLLLTLIDRLLQASCCSLVGCSQTFGCLPHTGECPVE